MASIKVSLDTRKKNSTETYPVVFRITHRGKSRDIASGILIKQKDWLVKSSSVSKTNHNYVLLNSKLRDLEQKYLAKVFEFEKQFPACDKIQELRDYIIGKNQQTETVHDFWMEHVEILYKANRNGGARVYCEALCAISKHRSLHIPFSSINYKFLEDLEADFIAGGVGINSIGVYYRALRAIYNKAINTGIAELSLYPFRRFKIRKSPTIPRALSLGEIRAYFGLQIAPEDKLYDSWLMGKLMFMMMGINYADLVKLHVENIRNGRVIYTRSKTNKLYSIFLHPEALSIITLFSNRKNSSLFGKITSADIKGSRRLPDLIHQANKVFNKHLEQLGEIIKCNEKLTGYCFRYTWANLARQMNYPIELISAGLGHSHGNKVTLGYLNPFDTDKVDTMNMAIIEEVIKKGE